MTNRRSPDRAAAGRDWNRFVAANAKVITASGIPTACLASIDHFDDFLTHGCLVRYKDDTGFRVESMGEEQYGWFVLLVESYFAAGYEWFLPGALRPAEQRRLASRFGHPGAK